MSQISWQHFEKVDIRLGSVIEAEPFLETRKPSIKLAADFGPESRGKEDQRPAYGVLLAGDAPRAAGGGGGELHFRSASRA